MTSLVMIPRHGPDGRCPPTPHGAGCGPPAPFASGGIRGMTSPHRLPAARNGSHGTGHPPARTGAASAMAKPLKGQTSPCACRGQAAAAGLTHGERRRRRYEAGCEEIPGGPVSGSRMPCRRKAGSPDADRSDGAVRAAHLASPPGFQPISRVAGPPPRGRSPRRSGSRCRAPAPRPASPRGSSPRSARQADPPPAAPRRLRAGPAAA